MPSARTRHIVLDPPYLSYYHFNPLIHAPLPLRLVLSSNHRPSKRARLGLNMPRLPAQRVWEHFWENFFLQCLGPKIGHFGDTPTCGRNGSKRAQVAPKKAKVELLEALSGSKRAQNCPNMPRKPSQRVQDHFCEPFLGPKLALSPVRGTALAAPPPHPYTARYGVLRVRWDHFEGWKPGRRGSRSRRYRRG